MSLNANVRKEVFLRQFLLTLLIWGNIRVSNGLWLTLPSSGTKCVSEELHTNVVVLADYVVVSDHHSRTPSISIKVTSPYGTSLHHRENITFGQFAFTTHEAGNYMACFWVVDNNRDNADVSVNIEWKTGIAARDWDSVAKKEKIEGVVLELRKLEAAVESIHDNLLFLKEREAELRIVNETTNARVAWLSMMSLGICILASVLQLWYLKRFFHKKKLL